MLDLHDLGRAPPVRPLSESILEQKTYQIRSNTLKYYEILLYKLYIKFEKIHYFSIFCFRFLKSPGSYDALDWIFVENCILWTVIAGSVRQSCPEVSPTPPAKP